jgi:hypothetical protein
MILVPHDEMVEARSSDRTNQPFQERILPRTPMGGEYFVNADVLHTIGECRAVD